MIPMALVMKELQEAPESADQDRLDEGAVAWG